MHPPDQVSSLCLCLLPVLKYDRADGGPESIAMLLEVPITTDGYSMKIDLVTQQRRESGKAPIIFVAIDAFC